MSTLQRLLAELRTAGPGTTLDSLADRLGVTRAEVELMVDFWRRRGALTVDPAGGCPTTRCGGCRLGCTGPTAALHLIRATDPR